MYAVHFGGKEIVVVVNKSGTGVNAGNFGGKDIVSESDLDEEQNAFMII